MTTIPKNPYDEDVDFSVLALQHAGFAKKLKVNAQLDFSDPESVRQLTKALLHRDFKLTIDLPEDRLCPPVPNRYDAMRPFSKFRMISDQKDSITYISSRSSLRALDQIMQTYYRLKNEYLVLTWTGASAIYPLLACSQHQNWFFLATEIDPKSQDYARKNVTANNLSSRIKVIAPDQDGQTILPSSQFANFNERGRGPLVLIPRSKNSYAINIQMTNPPFYSSEEELLTSAKQKSRPPNTACTGAPIEMTTPGGEVEFVSRIITESTSPRNRTKIQWFSSMLGKLSSVEPVVNKIRQAQAQVDCGDNYVVTEFIQGQKTKRWCVAWSFAGLRPPSIIARGGLGSSSGISKALLPFPNDFEFEIPWSSSSSSLTITTHQVSEMIDNELSRLDLNWTALTQPPSHNQDVDVRSKYKSGIGRSKKGDVWSRRARRKKQQGLLLPMDQEMKDVSVNESQDEVEDQEYEYDVMLPLAFRITVGSKVHVPKSQPATIVVCVRWLQGHDSKLFESFSGWLKRRIERQEMT